MSIFDDDFDFDDIIEADIEYGLFEEDDKIQKKLNQKKNQKQKVFGIFLKFNKRTFNLFDWYFNIYFISNFWINILISFILRLNCFIIIFKETKW